MPNGMSAPARLASLGSLPCRPTLGSPWGGRYRWWRVAADLPAGGLPWWAGLSLVECVLVHPPVHTSIHQYGGESEYAGKATPCR